MEEQLRLEGMKQMPIDDAWLLKYPPARVGPDILGSKFDAIAIPCDAVALVIDDVDRWIDFQIKGTDLMHPITLGPVLVSWGILAIVPSWRLVSEAIIAHACGETYQRTCMGSDLNAISYGDTGDPRIESRVIVDENVPLLISTYMITTHTEVKLARDIEIMPKYGCVE